MPSVTVHSPAKINLFLAVTGRRPDGYHDLLSLVAPLTFGDTLAIALTGRGRGVTLTCEDPAVPTAGANLAVRAAAAFREATGLAAGVDLHLRKRIPMGAGLGGGSSNAAAVLRGLNALTDNPLGEERLHDLAAALGSDCPLFLAGEPCTMRGRGDRIEPVPPTVADRLTGRRILLFKPGFSIATPWAYSALDGRGGRGFLDPREAEARLAEWMGGLDGPASVLFNTFEAVVFGKFLALPALLGRLARLPGVEGVLMSGSGSACFALLAPGAAADEPVRCIADSLGPNAFVHEAEITGGVRTGDRTSRGSPDGR